MSDLISVCGVRTHLRTDAVSDPVESGLDCSRRGRRGFRPRRDRSSPPKRSTREGRGQQDRGWRLRRTTGPHPLLHRLARRRRAADRQEAAEHPRTWTTRANVWSRFANADAPGWWRSPRTTHARNREPGRTGLAAQPRSGTFQRPSPPPTDHQLVAPSTRERHRRGFDTKRRRDPPPNPDRSQPPRAPPSSIARTETPVHQRAYNERGAGNFLIVVVVQLWMRIVVVVSIVALMSACAPGSDRSLQPGGDAPATVITGVRGGSTDVGAL